MSQIIWLEKNFIKTLQLTETQNRPPNSKKFIKSFFWRKVLYLKALIEGKSSKCFPVLHVKCQHYRQSFLLSLENKLNSSARICPSDRFINLSKRYSLSHFIDLWKYLLRKTWNYRWEQLNGTKSYIVLKGTVLIYARHLY